jgi:serine protease inhibitor
MNLTSLCRTLAPLVTPVPRTASLVILAVSIATAACSDPNGPAPTELTELPRPLTSSEQKLIGGSNAFAFDLLRQVNTSDRAGSVFVSPLSASMALGMTLNGAAGDTYTAMHGTLRFGDLARTDVNEGYKSLIALLRGLDPSTEFRIANSIWYEKTFPFHASFIDESKLFFDAQVQGLDFANPASVDVINSWVSDATSKKIPKIIDGVDDNVMFLINAIYFKGAWKTRFDKSKTVDAPFYALDGSTSNVPLMTQSEGTRTVFGAGYSAFDLPYGNTAFSMTVVLPDKGVDINSFTESLSEAKWAAIDEGLREGNIDIYLPRFKLTWEKKLSPDLIDLGMGIAFTEGMSDFTRMSPKGRDLVISEVIQKTFVEVNEEGTEAAAATSVGIMPTSLPPSIRVDRPFIFAIRERFSGTILFIGKVTRLPA